MLLQLESKLPQVVLGWFVLMAVASAVRIAVSPLAHVDATALSPYLLLILAPIASFLLATRWFADYPGRTPAGALPAAWLPA